MPCGCYCPARGYCVERSKNRVRASIREYVSTYVTKSARFPDRVGAAASFYGTWLVSDAEESPHLNFEKTRGELYIACAEHDELAPIPMVEKLMAAFSESGAKGEIEMYPGVHHGFAFPNRWCFEKQAAERHWERLIGLYRRQLG